MHKNIFAEERKRKIIRLIEENEKIFVSDLCELFNVSPVTIRNDLRNLEQEHLLTRTHGGAIKYSKTNFELNSDQKKVKNITAKKAIAAVAASMIESGDTIGLDTGTTIYELALLLGNKHNLQVVTTDIIQAKALEQFDINILVTGGFLRNRFNCLHGSITEDCLKRVNIDKSFIACNGFSFTSGLSTPDISVANSKAAMIAASKQKILLCDSSKFNYDSFAIFAPISDIDIIITDSHIKDDDIRKIEKEGVTLEIAQV